LDWAVFYVIKSKLGREVENYSAVQREKEVLFKAGTKFKVLETEEPDDWERLPGQSLKTTTFSNNAKVAM
jgi:hypothetical protein